MRFPSTGFAATVSMADFNERAKRVSTGKVDPVKGAERRKSRAQWGRPTAPEAAPRED